MKEEFGGSNRSSVEARGGRLASMDIRGLGLTSIEAASRLARDGFNEIASTRGGNLARLILGVSRNRCS